MVGGSTRRTDPDHDDLHVPDVQEQTGDSGRPERPAVTGQAPAPLSGEVAIPDAVKRALRTWNVSLSLGGFAIITMVLSRRGLADHLTGALLERDPSIAETTLDSATKRIVLAAAGALLLVVVVELLLVRRIAGRHAWPRLALVPVVVLHLVIALLASLLVPLGVWQGWALTIALYLGIVLAFGGTVLSFFPGVSAWAHQHRHERDLS